MRIISPADIGAVVKGRRAQLELSQLQLAERAHVSRKWVSDLERGKPKAEFAHVLAVLEALDLELTVNPRITRDIEAELQAMLDDLQADS